MRNQVIVVAKIRAKKGRGDELAALLTEQVSVVRREEPGCLAYRLHRSAREPDLFLFYEAYEDEAAFARHRAAPHLAAYRERREKEGLLDGAVEVEVYGALTD